MSTIDQPSRARASRRGRSRRSAGRGLFDLIVSDFPHYEIAEALRVIRAAVQHIGPCGSRASPADLIVRRRVFPRPLSVEDALRVVERWLGHPRAQVAHPSERHAEILGRLLKSAGAAGNLTTDAHLAALAIEHGAVVPGSA